MECHNGSKRPPGQGLMFFLYLGPQGLILILTTQSVLPGAEILGFSVCIYEDIPACAMRTTEPMTPALHEAWLSAEVMRTPLFGVDSFRWLFLSK